MLPFKWKAEAKAIFLNQFTVCSSCKRKFVICPFVDEETNGIYLLANGLNGLLYIIFVLYLSIIYVYLNIPVKENHNSVKVSR